MSGRDGPSRAERQHYSYTFYADPANARTFDDRRFGGPIGALVARQQAAVLAAMLGEVDGLRVLDVGTGTGRAALLLAQQGAQVTGVDASAQMLDVARQRAAADHVDVTFLEGDAHALAFPDRSFDVAVSLRVLMHAPDWRRCLAELCRVADGRIVIDYPSARSAAAIQAAARRVAHAAGRPTEPYRVLSDRAVARALADHDFSIRAVDRQFVLPIALHKLIGSASTTEATEAALARLGLLRLFGSPVTIVAERCASS